MRISTCLGVIMSLAAATASADGLGGLLGNNPLQTLEQQGQAALQGQGGSSGGGSLQGISQADQVGGMRQALEQGAQTAVATLGKTNGFLDNPRVKIPLPGRLQQVDGLMHQIGLGRYSDDLFASMNHAAEQAVPQAQTILISAVKNMSVSDVRGILTGGDDSATQYFRRTTSPAIAARFQPIIHQSMDKVVVASMYDRYAGQAAQFGLVNQQDSSLEGYITQKALDGLFLMMADEEKQIRQHPLQAAGSLARKVFSALQ